MPRQTFDVAVIGATRAGWRVAEASRRLGARVALFDSAPDLRAHEIAWLDIRSRLIGLWTAVGQQESATASFREVARAIFQDAAKAGRPLSDVRGASTGISLFDGPVELRSNEELRLADQSVIRFRSAVIAAGSRPRRPERFFAACPSMQDAVGFIEAGRIPRSVVVVGADWSGCEWSFVLGSLGCSVLLIDRRSRLLRSLDAEFRLAVQEQLHRIGVEIVLDEEIARVGEGRHGEVQIEFASGRRWIAEAILMLAGHVGETTDLGLDRLGVELDGLGHVAIDEFGRSSVRSILAIGSVADSSGMFPVTLPQAEIIAKNALGADEPLDTDLPWVLHSHPQIAVCGLTEETCRTLDLPIAVGNASSLDAPAGTAHARVIADRSSGVLLGTQVSGAGAEEAAYIVSNAIRRSETVRDVVARSCAEGTAAERVWRACREIQEQVAQPTSGIPLARIQPG